MKFKLYTKYSSPNYTLINPIHSTYSLCLSKIYTLYSIPNYRLITPVPTIHSLLQFTLQCPSYIAMYAFQRIFSIFFFEKQWVFCKDSSVSPGQEHSNGVRNWLLKHEIILGGNTIISPNYRQKSCFPWHLYYIEFT